MPTIDHNGKQLHVEDKVFKVYTMIKADRTLATQVKLDFNRAISPYNLSEKEILQLKKLLP